MPARTQKPGADNPNKPLVQGPRKPEQAGNANLPPPLFGILILAGLVVAAAGLRQTSNIVGPFFLVLTIVITVDPLGSWLVSRKVPQGLASVASLLTVYALLIIVLGSVVWTLARLGNTLPATAPSSPGFTCNCWIPWPVSGSAARCCGTQCPRSTWVASPGWPSRR